MNLGHSLPLGSFLLKPVQRILKYHLLLQVLTHAVLTQSGVCRMVIVGYSAVCRMVIVGYSAISRMAIVGYSADCRVLVVM